MPDAQHVKPTREELEENARKAAEEVDKLDAEEKEKNATEPIEDNIDEDEEEEEEVVAKKEEPQEKKPEEKEDEEEDIDWKKRYADSSREATIIASKEKKLAEAYDKAAEIPEPTEEELAQEYPDWDMLSDFEKKVARRTTLNDKRFAMIEGVRKEFKDIEAWGTKVDTFVSDPITLTKNPSLEGKTDEFKLFAAKQSRMGVDFDILIPAFLHEQSLKRVKHKGKMFETGTGGSNERQNAKGDKLTLEQGEILRKTDYRKWTQYIKAGKISNE